MTRNVPFFAADASSDAAQSLPLRLVVVAPTYNNARTLTGTIEAISSALGLPAIVVNDGCDDGSDRALARWAAREGDVQRWVVTHQANLGKAAALRTGFDRARQLGFTHAITIDTDGQHDLADVPALIELARRHPDALIVGARPMGAGNYPLGSRVGRLISNCFVRIESGARLSDSQCGLRIYPLGPVAQVNARTSRFGFETEVITRLAWAGVPIFEAPIRCIYEVEGGRTTHFRPVRDSIAATFMHLGLMHRSIFPWPVKKIAMSRDGGAANPSTGTIVSRLGRWMNPMRVWRQVRHDARERRRLASSIATGMLLATLPPLGFKTVAALLISKWLRLQPLVVVAVSSLNTPPVGPLLAAAGIATGHVVLHGKFPRLAGYSFARYGTWETLKMIGIEWLVGSLVVGIGLATITYAMARIVMLFMPLAKKPDLEARNPALNVGV